MPLVGGDGGLDQEDDSGARPKAKPVRSIDDEPVGVHRKAMDKQASSGQLRSQVGGGQPVAPREEIELKTAA